MKRYVRYILATSEFDIVDSTLFTNTPFVPDTDVPYYNEFLNSKELNYKQRAKNRTGEIVLMSPTEYFNECSQHGFSIGPVDVNHVIQGRRADKESIQWLENHMKQGGKFYLPYIDYAAHSQEGLHRMMVAGDLYGWDTKFPVLVVTVYDEDVERENQLFQDYLDFRDHDFKIICDMAADELSDWYGPVPDNFEEMLRHKVIEIASDYEDGYDIDVSVQVDEVEGDHRVFISLDRYFDYDSSDRYEGSTLWLENLYDVNGDCQKSPTTTDDNFDDILRQAEDQGIDLDDYDSIMKLLFKD